MGHASDMDSFDSVDAETILGGRSDWIDVDLALRLAEHPLEGVETEFPHWVGAVDSPEAFDRPSDRHPVFYGCYDWHSAVHSHWCLVRLLRLFDDHPDESRIREGIDERLTAENVERELERFEDDPTFEKPYGWAWLLRLAAELYLWDDPVADEWRTTLRPLESRIVDLVESEFLTDERPFRVGTHENTAFALAGVVDYALVTGDGDLAAAAGERARAFYLEDSDYPVEYEPLGWDFLSPALAEADLMRRVLDRREFADWFDGFLPDVRAEPYDAVLDPVAVEPDSDEGVEYHLIGLNLSRAWCLAGVADALADHRDAEALERSAERHARRGVRQAFTDDYAGAHWLSSFAVYLLTRDEGGIAPAESRA